ncbi:MAG: hypothetical protein HYX65_07805 [Gemmatimonadetes bacterium]|nr:hypothetical protein [Gemmatimonadota bacterium]
MLRFIFALILGCGAGYFVGWQDAQSHKQNIVERLVERAGGSTRGKIGTNPDSLMKDAEKAAPVPNR